MTQDIVNNNQSISYTNLDFPSIYTEVLNLAKDLTYRWDPSISDESDPGVILAKLSALIADKCNYNIDKSILEAFPLSVTQDANAQQLYEQLGYYMNWYESATAPLVLTWVRDSSEPTGEVKSYTIPKLFAIVTDDEDQANYTIVGIEGPNGVIVSDGILTTDSKELRMIAMEGVPLKYSYLGKETVITAQMVDKYTHRLYFNTPDVSQNGVFITNTGQNNYADWKRVDNIYEQSYNDLRYKFGYDNFSNTCYLEFPDNYSELFGDGIEITYLNISNSISNVPAQRLTKFLEGITPVEDPTVVLDSSNVAIQNYAAAYGHKEKEDINEAYRNYKKTVGTFRTLITLRDYLNYIKSKELDICSNAFVCDRTNDIQSVYKIVSKQHDLDSIIVKVEQVIDKTSLESNYDYKFQLTADQVIIPGKNYYTINNDTLSEVSYIGGENPQALGWYEFVSRVVSSHDALSAFSLKFYLLNNSISLNSKNAYDETFEMTTQELDLNMLLDDTAHLEHSYEDILPLGESTYKVTSDETFLENKAYYIKENDNIHFKLFTDYVVGNSTSLLTTTIYEVDVEALMPHIVMFKNLYPLTVNISTYDILNEKTQEDVQKNIINALYAGVNSSQIDFGADIEIDYLADIIKTSDDRIKDAYFNKIDYVTKAIYFDGSHYNEVVLADSCENSVVDQKNKNAVLARQFEKDILAKSILSGVTHLYTPDDEFAFHLNQRFINYYDDVYSVTSQAVIDIGGDDVVTTYSSDYNHPYIRQSYQLKPNETISLYRPQLQTIREFTSGIHYECFLYNGIKAGQTYELQKNEYIIFYQGVFTDTSDKGAPNGFAAYACTEGILLTPSFDIAAQTNYNSLTNFGRGKVIPNFDVAGAGNWFETNTYAYSYTTEIYNNSTIVNNAIKGVDTVKIQNLQTIDIELSDNYKFFWVLKTPQYSANKKLKTFTLFPRYDASMDRTADKEKNSYTLKDGEWLYYMDSSFSNLAILGAGTTIYRTCGVNTEYDDDSPFYSFSFVNTKEFTETGTDLRFKDGILETITSQLSDGTDAINPKANGWFEAQGTTPETYERSLDVIYDSSKDYYVLVMNDNSGLYKRIGDEPPYQHSSTLQSSDVFSEVNLQSYLCNISPVDEDWYELVTVMNSRVTDFYALSDGASYNNYLRYTKSLDDSILTRSIFTNAGYSDVDISDINTYKTITITAQNAEDFDYLSQRLLVPSDGDNSYKQYYTDITGTTRVTNIQVSDVPSTVRNHLGIVWYEESTPGVFTPTSDTHPVLSTAAGSVKYPTSITENYCFDEVPLNTWNPISFADNGYFYKNNSAEASFVWDRDKSSVIERATPAYLSYLLSAYNDAKNHYPNDDTGVVNYMIANWRTAVVYNHPFKVNGKAGWRTKRFIEAGNETPTFLGMDKNMYAEYASRLSSYDIYPRYDKTMSNGAFTSNIDVVVPITAADAFTPEDYELLTELIENPTVPYIEILDRVGTTDSSNVAYLQNLFETFNNKYMAAFGMELQVKVFKFKDLFRLSEKSYFKPNTYVTKTFAPIDDWTCIALDNDEIATDPIAVIKDNWQSLQDNTSMRIVQNDMWSFAEGDVLRFEAPVVSQSSIVWPKFSNTEIVLDLDSYGISYQRNGGEIQEISKLSMGEYEWRAHSSLLLNTSDKDGQKLEPNHSIILYKPIEDYSADSTYEVGDKCIYEHITYECIQSIPRPEAFNIEHWTGAPDYFAIIDGKDFENTTFQLRHPVANRGGRYIDVTYEDVYEQTVPNAIYEFVPLTSGTNYKYVTEYNTQAMFNVVESPAVVGPSRVVDNTQVKIPLLLPKGDYILPVHTTSNGVRYWVSKYVEAKFANSSNYYCINMTPTMSTSRAYNIRIGHNVDENGEPYGEQLFGCNKDKFVGLSNSEFYINDTKYHYLDVDVDVNPESHDYIKVSIPGHLTEYYSERFGLTASPAWFGWYELVDNQYVLSEDTHTGAGLFEQVEIDVTDYNEVKTYNPCELTWYEYLDEYILLESEPSDWAANWANYYVYNSTTNAYDALTGSQAPTFATGTYFKLEHYYGLSTDTVADINKTYYKDKDFYVCNDNVKAPVLKVNADNPLENVEEDQVLIIFGDTFRYVKNPLLSDDLFCEVKEKIRRLDDEGLYNYAFKPSANDLIKDPLVPSSYFENNHPFNKFTIAQLDFNNLECRFTTRNTSRR